ASRREPVAEGGAGALRPRAQVLERHRSVIDELRLAETYLARREPDVVREDDLIQPLERIGADRGDDLAREPELFLDLAQHGLLRGLVRLEESRDEDVPGRRIAAIPDEDDPPVALDDRGDDRDRVVPVNEAAIVPRADEPLAAAALGLDERRAATRTEPERRVAHGCGSKSTGTSPLRPPAGGHSIGDRPESTQTAGGGTEVVDSSWRPLRAPAERA